MPDPVQPVVHPPIPLGLGSYVSLTGISGAAASFLIAWGENSWHLTGPIAALGVTAGAAVIGFFASRSHQAAELIKKTATVLGEVGVTVSPTPDPTVPPPTITPNP